MNIKSVTCVLALGSMVVGLSTSPARASWSLEPETALAITAAGIALLEGPRVLAHVKACTKNLLHRAWAAVKPPIAKAANKTAKIGMTATAVTGLIGALCNHVEFDESVLGYQINENTFYSMAATTLPLSYLAYRTACKLSDKPNKDKGSKAKPVVEIQVHGKCTCTATS